MDMTVNAKVRRAATPRTQLGYQAGFGNTFSSEAIKGSLPQGRNSPQRPPKGLYAEVLSGTAFTAPRAENLSTWLYKLRPSAMHGPYRRVAQGQWRSGPFDEVVISWIAVVSRRICLDRSISCSFCASSNCTIFH